MKITSAITHTAHLVDLWLSHKIQYDRVPGMSIGIFYKDRALYQKGFGFADLKQKTKMKGDSLYRVASMSKMFTTAAILQLQERGLLKLDDPVSRHLSWFKGKNKISNLGSVTIRHVLSHTSGLFRDGEKPYWSTHLFPKKLSDTVSNRSIIFTHSKQFKYSNHAFSVLGEVIKVVSGLPYGQYMRKNILAVLRMRSTYPDLPQKVLPGLAKGYGRIIPDKKGRGIFPEVYTRAYAPATGFISNVPDLARFLGSLVLRSSGPQILTERSKREMMKIHAKTVHGDHYGLGLQITKVAKKKFVGHSGGFAGYQTYATLNPKDGVGVISLSNSLTSQASNIGEGILATLYYFATQSQSNKIRSAAYEGIYRGRWSDTIVAEGNGSLIAFDSETNNPVKNRTTLQPLGRHSFRIETIDTYDSPGEMAVFTSFKNEKAQKLIWGTDPKTRVR